MSKVDLIYRKLLLTRFFTQGWGSPEDMKALFHFKKSFANREKCKNLVSKDYPVFIDKDEVRGDYRLMEGHFQSPFNINVPHLMPLEVQTARFQVVLPKVWKSIMKPMVIHLAGTGDHYFWRRRNLLAKPLIKQYGIGSVILENPYYGVRKPKQQLRSSLLNVTDLFVMGGALILESMVLLHWCENQGYGPLGLTGISMGGHMASLAATNWDKPVSLIPCLSWSSASPVFTQGVMSSAIPWKTLASQMYHVPDYMDDISKLFHSNDDNKTQAFREGVEFAKAYNDFDLTFEEDKHSASFKQALHRLNAMRLFKRQSENESTLHGAAVNFMRGVMDEFTHLGNYSIPVDPKLVIIVAATNDAYIPHDRVTSLCDLWKGAELRYIHSGHIAAFLLKQAEFRKAIHDSIERQIEMYYKPQDNISEPKDNEMDNVTHVIESETRQMKKQSIFSRFNNIFSKQTLNSVLYIKR